MLYNIHSISHVASCLAQWFGGAAQTLHIRHAQSKSQKRHVFERRNIVGVITRAQLQQISDKKHF